VEEADEQPDLAARQADIAAAMDETLERQQQLQKRQDALLEELQKIDRALDRDKPDSA
jgi:phage tail tape-measure protein